MDWDLYITATWDRWGEEKTVSIKADSCDADDATGQDFFGDIFSLATKARLSTVGLPLSETMACAASSSKGLAGR